MLFPSGTSSRTIAILCGEHGRVRQLPLARGVQDVAFHRPLRARDLERIGRRVHFADREPAAGRLLDLDRESACDQAREHVASRDRVHLEHLQVSQARQRGHQGVVEHARDHGSRALGDPIRERRVAQRVPLHAAALELSLREAAEGEQLVHREITKRVRRGHLAANQWTTLGANSMARAWTERRRAGLSLIRLIDSSAHGWMHAPPASGMSAKVPVTRQPNATEQRFGHLSSYR
jgi:hypothetical protein